MPHIHRPVRNRCCSFILVLVLLLYLYLIVQSSPLSSVELLVTTLVFFLATTLICVPDCFFV